uniref:Putative actin binding protein anillin n=1 Tax=Xenopsylla cheopis TaxID=163159 RepID=A0A6M2DUL3_XENCH
MDPDTQGYLDRVRARNERLKNKANKLPLSESNTRLSPRRSMTSPSKIIKTVSTESSDSKENVDVAVEINILTSSNVQVDVQVEERQLEDGETVDSKFKRLESSNFNADQRLDRESAEQKNEPPQPLLQTTSKNRMQTLTALYSGADQQKVSDNVESQQPVLRTTSKNRLQRLGTLYSEDADLSSPIHRTEKKFDEEMLNANGSRNVRGARSERFAALASTINTWEDDLSHHQSKKKYKAPSPPKQIRANEISPIRSPIKVLFETGDRITDASSASASYSRVSSPSKRVKEGSPTRSPIKISSRIGDTINHTTSSTVIYSNRSSPTKSTGSTIHDESVTSSASSSPSKSICNSPTKQLQWDQKVLQNLESQGYRRSETSDNLVYDYTNSANTNRNNKITPCKPMNPVITSAGDSPKIINSVVLKPSPKKNPAPDVPKTVRNTQVKIVDTLTKASKKNLFCEKSSQDTNTTDQLNSNKDEQLSQPSSPQKVAPKLNKSAAMMSKTALFENVSPRKDIDPALLTVQERLALFEKNKGTALTPKAPFGIAPYTKSIMQKPKAPEPTAPPVSNNEDTSSSNSSINYCSGGIKSKVAALFSNSEKTISQSQIAAQTEKQRKKDMDLLLNRFQKPKQGEPENSKQSTTEYKAPPPPPAMPEPSAPCLDNSSNNSTPNKTPKKVTIISPKNYHLYPTLPDLPGKDFTESESYNESNSQDSSMEPLDYDSEMMDDSQMDSSDATADVSLGHEIMKAVHKNQSPSRQNRSVLMAPDSSACSTSCSEADDINDVLCDMNRYLDGAISGNQKDPNGPSPPKRGRSLSPGKSVTTSTSFCYKSGKALEEQPVLSIDTVDGKQNNMSEMSEQCGTSETSSDNETAKLPLVHTVSFYRRQTQQSPTRTITHKVEHFSPPKEEEEDFDDTGMIEEKIRQLTEEVSKQQIIISQSSQALNLCEATIEFSGSPEQVDGEKHLLVATHRRQAALHEIQRLKVEGYIRPRGAPTEKGSLYINAITLPLRADYIRTLATDTHPGHHLVCLIRHQERVISTQIICTLPGLHSMRFQDSIRMEDMYADFKVTLEVYGMEAKKQLLPHDVKYHIGLKKPSKGTPMKTTKNDSRLARPMIQSPAGPSAVRTPQLILLGYIIFSLKEIQRQQWTLNKPAPGSPLDGNIQMRLNCELSVSVQYQGFLTMYEDVSGFGAWHRRWCVLNAHTLNYWKYPDDENKKAPIGSLDLRGCTTKVVGLVSRDICARLHTIMLEFSRPAKDNDIESLILIKNGNEITTRHLLSADTKEERIEWGNQFNKALSILRAWGGTQN